MPSISDAISELTRKALETAEQFVTVKFQFEELRRFAKDTADEQKRLLERLQDRIDRIERERITKEAELQAKIDALSSRLDALSERALHAAVERTAETVIRELASGRSASEIAEARRLLNRPEES